MGFNGRLAQNSFWRTCPASFFIAYDKFFRYLALWFGGVTGIFPDP
jgi:hypothetical protein